MEIGELNNSADTKMADWIKSVKDVFDQSNGIISEFEKKQEESKEQYKKHYIASFLISEKYRESKQKKELAENRVSAIRSIVSQKEQEQKELRNRLDSVDKGKDELNKFIKIFLNREDLIIEVTEDKYFVLNRNGKIATHLSDGEKTAIAFSHFMVMLKSLKEEGYQLLNEEVLLDYIKFLESNGYKLTGIEPSSLMNYLIFSNGVNECHVFTLDTSTNEWITFEIYDGNTKREQVEFIKNLENNKVAIYYCGHFTEGEKEKIVVSGYTLDYGVINISWAKRREMSVEDFNSYYDNSMDLKELVLRADVKGINYQSSEDLKNEKKLKLGY